MGLADLLNQLGRAFANHCLQSASEAPAEADGGAKAPMTPGSPRDASEQARSTTSRASARKNTAVAAIATGYR